MKQIWSKSIREEIIGVLWLILAMQLVIAHASWIFFTFPLFMGISSEIEAIIFAFKESKEEEH